MQVFRTSEAPTQVFCEWCEIFRNTDFKEYLRTAAFEYRFILPYHFRALFQSRFINKATKSSYTLQIQGRFIKHFKALFRRCFVNNTTRLFRRLNYNIILSVIWRRCSEVFITSSFYQEHKNVAWTSFNWRLSYNLDTTSWYGGATSQRKNSCNKRLYYLECLLGRSRYIQQTERCFKTPWHSWLQQSKYSFIFPLRCELFFKTV